MALALTAKFVITSIWSAQESEEIIRFVYLLELPRWGDSNKYTKRMIYKKNIVQKYPLLML